LTVEAVSKYYCVLYWDVGRTNIPDSKGDVLLTSPHSAPLGPVGGSTKNFKLLILKFICLRH